MDQITFREVPDLPSIRFGQLGDRYPHYRASSLRRLLALATDWSTKFTPNVNRKLEQLAETPVWIDDGKPLVVGSGVVGQVSWMEDFTLFAIHPDRDWDVDLPRAVASIEYELTVNCAVGYKGDNGLAGEALVYDPTQPLSSKQRSDIKRAVKSVGPVNVTLDGPSIDQLAAGVLRWNRHALSGDYFLWQWLWAEAAGEVVHIEAGNFEAWLGFVDYGCYRVFTAYHADGDCNGMGTACLQHALDFLAERDRQDGGRTFKVVLTAPLLPEWAARYDVAKYETYKRRFANDSLPVHFLKGVWCKEELPYPPYYNAQTREMVHA